MQSRKWDKLNIKELQKTINRIKDTIEAMKKIKDKKLKQYDNQRAREIYYKLLDFKNVLIAKRDYLKALETHREIENLKKNIDYKTDKNNLTQKDINEIEETQKLLDKTKEMINKRIKVCEKHISKKNTNPKYLYFVDEMQYVLTDLNIINESLKRLASEIDNLKLHIIFNTTWFIKDNTKKLKKEYDETIDARSQVEDDDDEDDEIEEACEANMKKFKRKKEKFENEYKKAYNILKDIDPKSTEGIKEIYNEFMKYTYQNDKIKK